MYIAVYSHYEKLEYTYMLDAIRAILYASLFNMQLRLIQNILP